MNRKDHCKIKNLEGRQSNQPKGGTSGTLGITSEERSKSISEGSTNSIYSGTISFNHLPEPWTMEPAQGRICDSHFTSDKEGHFIIINGSILPKNIIFQVYIPNNKASKHMRQKWIKLQDKIDGSPLELETLPPTVRNGQK